MHKIVTAVALSLMTMSAAIAAPDRATTASTKSVVSSGQSTGEMKQATITKEAKFQVAPTNLDSSKLNDKKLDGNIGETGAATSTGAMGAPGI